MTYPVIASVRKTPTDEAPAIPHGWAASTATSTGAVGPVPFLAADIGGTHARLGLVAPQADGSPRVLAYRSYRCADHPHLDDIVRDFCAGLDAHPRELVLASAGYLHAGVVVNRNLAWPLVPATLERELGLERVRFLNDFEALAHAIAHVDDTTSVPLKAAFVPDSDAGPVAVIGPGTGLGAAVWFPGEPPRVLATEAGQMQDRKSVV